MTTPYYADDAVTLYHGDCRELTAWLEADVLVTDPPYGRRWRQGEVKSAGMKQGHARNAASLTGIANDTDTAARDAALALWGTDRRAIVFGDLMLPPPPQTRLVCCYRKPVDAGLRGAMGGVRRDLEAVYLMNRWPSGIGGRSSLFATAAVLVGSPNGVVAKAGGHPHTKPLDVMSDLLLLTEGVIADPIRRQRLHVVCGQAPRAHRYRRRTRRGVLRDRGPSTVTGHLVRRCRMTCPVCGGAGIVDTSPPGVEEQP